MDVCTCQDVFPFSSEESRLGLKHGLDNTYWKSSSFSKNILSLAVVSKSIPSKPVSAHRAMIQFLVVCYNSQHLPEDMKPSIGLLRFYLGLALSDGRTRSHQSSILISMKFHRSFHTHIPTAFLPSAPPTHRLWSIEQWRSQFDYLYYIPVNLA